MPGFVHGVAVPLALSGGADALRPSCRHSVLLQLMVKKASTRQREARAEETPSLAIEEIVAECHACEALKGKAEPACRRLLSMPSQTTRQ